MANGRIDAERTKLGASLKSWIAIIIAIVGFSFSIGVWAAVGDATKKDVDQIKVTIEKMPKPDNIAKKDLVETQQKFIVEKLSDIQGSMDDKLDMIQTSVDDVEKKLDRHIQQSGRTQ